MKVVRFSLETGNEYYGKVDGRRFFIGQRVAYQGRKGLMNTRGDDTRRYDRVAHSADHGFWADFIHPTAMAEGALYHTLNTYDRARFTFSFLQFAAHVPDGDFVVYLRKLLGLPLASEYFPDLEVSEGRICRVDDSTAVLLESSSSTSGLMDYLNPSSHEVEDTEVIQAAKLVDWAQTDPLHRQLQVDIGIGHFKRNMLSYSKRYGLDGAEAAVCAVVADIRHQGRAKSELIIAALENADPLQALLKIGEPLYHNRIVTLRSEINALVAEGSFNFKYDQQSADFVPA